MRRLAVSVATGALFSLAGAAQADTVFQDDFTGALGWSTSNASVYIKDSEFLYIGSDGRGYNDWAERTLGIDLSESCPVIIEQRLRLESLGQNYRLPWETVYFEDATEAMITYLPSLGGLTWGWAFGERRSDGSAPFTGVEVHPVPDADTWAVTRIVVTPHGGTLFVKPDDAANGWYSDQFYEVVSATWSHSQIAKIRFDQPWDSVNYIDYVRIDTTCAAPVPSAAWMGLGLLGGVGLVARLRKRRSAASCPVGDGPQTPM